MLGKVLLYNTRMDSKTKTIPQVLLENGFVRLEKEDLRRIRGFATWEKDGARIALASEALGVFRGFVNRYDGDGSEMTVQGLEVDPGQRRKGHARAVVSLVVEAADALGYTLYVEPVKIEQDDAAISWEALVIFYESLGFSFSDSSCKVMVLRARLAHA